MPKLKGAEGKTGSRDGEMCPLDIILTPDSKGTNFLIRQLELNFLSLATKNLNK